jgi:hypothetical protein
VTHERPGLMARKRQAGLFGFLSSGTLAIACRSL